MVCPSLWCQQNGSEALSLEEPVWMEQLARWLPVSTLHNGCPALDHLLQAAIDDKLSGPAILIERIQRCNLPIGCCQCNNDAGLPADTHCASSLIKYKATPAVCADDYEDESDDAGSLESTSEASNLMGKAGATARVCAPSFQMCFHLHHRKPSTRMSA